MHHGILFDRHLVRDGPLEITGGGVTIPPKNSCNYKGNLSNKNPANGDAQKKILAEEALCIAFKVIKSISLRKHPFLDALRQRPQRRRARRNGCFLRL